MSHAKPPFGKESLQSLQNGEDSEGAVQMYETESGKQAQITELVISGSKWQLVPCGKFFLPMDGYIRFDLEGLSRVGNYFADVTHLVIIPESDWFTEQTNLKFVADPSDFYWGRRGPSVHLRYIPPPGKEIEYFYSELTVPVGGDVIGSYFCAAGIQIHLRIIKQLKKI